MEETALLQAQEDLLSWGVLEASPVLAPTRRFRAALARAAAELRVLEQAGTLPPGHPMERAVALALETYPLPPDAQVQREHRMLVVAVELASLPEAVRSFLDQRA